MSNGDYRLVVGDKNYSSWSLRPWLLMRVFGIAFEEINVDICRPGVRARVLEHSPSAKVPALKAGALTIWDTLAIIEYLAETHGDLAIWPREREARAMARVVSAEMHSGFDNLRSELPMDMTGSKPVEHIAEGVAGDVTRIVDIWRMCRTAYGNGGPYLFGEFCGADAMFAPVTSRLRTYGVDLGAHGDDGAGKAYCETILSLPEIEEWTQAGRTEMSERGTAY